MSTPGFILGAAPSSAPVGNPSAGSGPAARGAVADAEFPDGNPAAGGFAAALEDASAPAQADAPTSEPMTADAARSEAAPSSADAAVASPAVAGTTSTPAATSPITEVIGSASDSAVAAGGWPPPGLSSLFPERPLFAAGGTLPAATPGAPLPMPAPPKPGAPAGTAAATPAPRLADGVIALPPDLLTPTGPRGPEPPLLAAAAGALAPSPAAALPSPTAPMLAAATAATSAATTAPPAATLAATLAALDPIGAALARQPATLRLPLADEGEARGFGALLEALAPERLPDGATPLSASSAALPKLDLAQAFPTPLPLPSPRFAEELGARLQWIAEQQGGDATLRLNPDGLGPVEIRLKLDGERVDLGFSASHQDARQALQDALPKLREMLAQQGLQLGDANVGQRHAGHTQDGAAQGERGFGDEEDGIVISAPRVNEATLVIGRGARGVLDLYA